MSSERVQRPSANHLARHENCTLRTSGSDLGKNLAQGFTSMPKDLESRTDWDAPAAQTGGRRSAPEIREPNVPESLFHTMGNSRLKSDVAHYKVAIPFNQKLPAVGTACVLKVSHLARQIPGIYVP